MKIENYLDRVEIANEIKRLRNLIKMAKEPVSGVCSGCGGSIKIHPIVSYLETMDSEQLSISLDIIPLDVIKVTLWNANRIRKSRGFEELGGSYKSVSYPPRPDESTYCISHYRGGGYYGKYTRLEKDGTVTTYQTKEELDKRDQEWRAQHGLQPKKSFFSRFK